MYSCCDSLGCGGGGPVGLVGLATAEELPWLPEVLLLLPQRGGQSVEYLQY